MTPEAMNPLENTSVTHTKLCSSCAIRVPASAAFCPACGVSQLPAPHPVQAPVQEKPYVQPPQQPAATGSYPHQPLQLGSLVAHYGGSWVRYLWFLLLAGLTVFGLVASLVDPSGSKTLIGFVFWGLVGFGCYVYYQRNIQREVSAQIFEEGFVITRGGRTTSARWEEIALVEHRIRTFYADFIIPISRTHTYHVLLNDGRRVKITSIFDNEKRLGETVQRMWMQARPVVRHGR